MSSTPFEAPTLEALAGLLPASARIAMEALGSNDLTLPRAPRTMFNVPIGGARRFAAQRRGGLVLMSSLLAFQGVPRAATYAATKAFVTSLTESLPRSPPIGSVSEVSVLNRSGFLSSSPSRATWVLAMKN